MPVRELVLEGSADRDLTKLASYREVGGFESLAKARSMEPGAIVEELRGA